MLPQTSAYVKRYERQIKWMCFLIADHDLLEKESINWDKVRADIKQ